MQVYVVNSEVKLNFVLVQISSNQKFSIKLFNYAKICKHFFLTPRNVNISGHSTTHKKRFVNYV